MLALWQAGSVIVAGPALPSPFEVAAGIAGTYALDLFRDLTVSLLRVAAGVCAAAVVGISCAFASYFWKRAGSILFGMIYLINPIPKIALLPVVLIAFGLGEAPKIFLVFLIAFPQFALCVRETLDKLPQGACDVMTTMGATRLQILRYLLLPACMPGILCAQRICLGTALSVLIFTETFGSEYGIGAFIIDAWMRVSYVEMYAGIVTLSVTGWAANAGLDSLIARSESGVCRVERPEKTFKR